MAATDQLFKEVLHQFLPGFLELFLPQVASRLDLSREPHFRDKEVFTDFPEGERREADVVAEVYAREGDPELILFHIEVQAKRRRDFSYRMWEYYSLLRLRTRLRVFPIVVYLSPGAGGLTWEEYSESLFEERLLVFRYGVIGLPDLPADNYSNNQEALSAALSTAMAPSTLGRVRHKLIALSSVARSDLDEARKLLLANFIETFLPLSDPAEAAEFAQRVASAESSQEIREMISIYEERGIAKGIEQGIEQGIERGIEQGIEQGIVRGERDILLRLLRIKFGPLPESTEQKIAVLSDRTELEALSERVLTANTLEEMGL